jgi:hypothetical protein
VKITNQSKKTLITARARLADKFLPRLIGLLDRDALEPDEALVITRCQSIHMFFMRFAIDAVFVDADNRVVGLLEGIKPFRFSPIYWKASYCIELPVGSIQRSQSSLGDELKIDKSA